MSIDRATIAAEELIAVPSPVTREWLLDNAACEQQTAYVEHFFVAGNAGYFACTLIITGPQAGEYLISYCPPDRVALNGPLHRITEQE